MTDYSPVLPGSSSAAEQDSALVYASGDSSNPALAAAKRVLVSVSERAEAGAEWRLMGGAGKIITSGLRKLYNSDF